MNRDRSPSITLEGLLATAGSDEPRLRQILTEVALNVLEQRLIVKDGSWHHVGLDDGFAKRFLSDALGPPERPWDISLVLGTPALAKLREVNGRLHARGTSRGAASSRGAVAALQGGEFCSMCGRHEHLAVDHVIPVSVGGPPHDVRNMQLLCKSCNLGKSALGDRLLPTAVAQRTAGEVPDRLRFKHLLLDGTVVDGRNRGVCRCGQIASATVELIVRVGVKDAAANLLTLTTGCTRCI